MRSTRSCQEAPLGSLSSSEPVSDQPVSDKAVTHQPTTYAEAGVDIDAADEAIRRFIPHVRSTFRPEVLTDIGGFGSMVAIPKGYDEPVLVSGTDGVGTKALVADACQKWDTIGIDLLAMCVDDIVTQGAEPLFFLDIITTGKVDPDRIEQLVSGMAEGCRQAGCSLTGGEIAEHPDAMEPHEWDIGGFVVGVVERDRIVDGTRISAGDVVMGIASPGIRCNGYSLARRVLMSEPSMVHKPAWPGADVTIGDEMLRPSVIYAPAVLELIDAVEVHGLAHVTGGGLASNLERVLPSDVDVLVDRAAWPVPPIFDEIARRGGVEMAEMERVFNLGIGMVAVVGPESVDTALSVLEDAGHAPFVIGSVVDGGGNVRFEAP